MAFSKHKADFTLLEVGLGGKLDATNVIPSPVLSIITPISLDHQQFLGDTVLKIASEKAGILKPFVPAIVGKQVAEVQELVCSIAENSNTPVSLFDRDWSSKKYKNSLIYEDNDGIIQLPAPNLEGLHQYENAGIAITALKLLKIRNDSISNGLQNAKWPARLQKLKSGPLVKQSQNLTIQVELWLDGGHNKAAAKAISSFLNQPFNGTSHIILGMISSKDYSGFLSEIAVIAESVGCIDIPDELASLSKEKIYKEAKMLNSNAFKAESVSAGLQKILNQNENKHNIRVLVCGSLYLCGHVLRDHK